jgi:hypothetical protein
MDDPSYWWTETVLAVTSLAETATSTPPTDFAMVGVELPSVPAGRCRGCAHRSHGSCPVCGGLLGHLGLGLPPCRYCPNGRPIVAGTINERIERIAEELAAWPHLVNAVDDVIQQETS